MAPSLQTASPSEQEQRQEQEPSLAAGPAKKRGQSTPPRRLLNPLGTASVILNLLLLALLSFSFFPANHKDIVPSPQLNITTEPTLIPPSKNAAMSSSEQTFIAIKPDGVQRGLIGPIISRFENRGFKLAAIKLVSPGKEHLETHYADLKDKAFFPGLISYMSSGPICAMVWEGRDAVKTGRAILGATNPLASSPGTIRGDFAIDVGRNVCHGSDSVENAKKEIALWFAEGDLVQWKSAQFDWIYEKA